MYWRKERGQRAEHRARRWLDDDQWQRDAEAWCR